MQYPFPSSRAPAHSFQALEAPQVLLSREFLVGLQSAISGSFRWLTDKIQFSG